MDSFGEFLKGMGYPSRSVQNPRDRTYTYPAFMDSKQVAGAVAWYYERDGMAPMLIGHSGGGVTVNRVLYDLAGIETKTIPVFNPETYREEPRHTIRDALTGAEREVVGLRVSYAAMLATGKLMRIFLLQWKDAQRIRDIPNSADEFTGFLIPGDVIAATSSEPEKYRSLDTTRNATVVRNVILPGSTDHIRAFQMQGFASNETARAWIDAYVPDAPLRAIPGDVAGIDMTNIVHAADIWHSVKKHWCIEVQRAIRARRAAESAPPRKAL
jgi:hypothetical protein